MLPGVSSDAITSVKPTSRWMQTLGRRESPQRALQDCKENASLESVVENSCDRGLHATTAPHERTLFVKAQNQVRMRTDRLAAMTFSTGHSKKGQGSTVRSVSREAMSWACISIISCFPDHGACRATRRHNLHPRAERHDDLLPAHQFGVHRATIPCTRPRAMTTSGPLTPE